MQHHDRVRRRRERREHHVDADEQGREALTRLPDADTDLHEDREHEHEQPLAGFEPQHPCGDDERGDERGEDVSGQAWTCASTVASNP